jgi:hypothetical protein
MMRSGLRAACSSLRLPPFPANLWPRAAAPARPARTRRPPLPALRRFLRPELDDGLAHGQPVHLPRSISTPLKFVIVVPFTSFAHKRDHLLGDLHQVVIVGIGLVELQHGELGIVLRAHALVAEVAVDLVDAVQAADDQALQIELRRDAQKQIQVERVVVRLKGRAAAPPAICCIIGVSTSR